MNNMKKKLLLLSLSAFLLTGCHISFLREEKEEGFEDDDHGGTTRVIEYYEGDTLELEGHIVHAVNFLANEENSQPVLSDNESVLAVLEDSTSFISEVTNISNISQFHGLKIGNLSDSVDGTITFKVNADVYAVEIYARPRSNLVASMEATVPVIDSQVALNVNDSKYIKVNCDFEQIEDITDSKLTYLINSEIKNEITVTAVHERAEIMQIVFYE